MLIHNLTDKYEGVISRVQFWDGLLFLQSQYSNRKIIYFQKNVALLSIKEPWCLDAYYPEWKNRNVLLPSIQPEAF